MGISRLIIIVPVGCKCGLSAVRHGEPGVNLPDTRWSFKTSLSYQSLYHDNASQVGLTGRVSPYL